MLSQMRVDHVLGMAGGCTADFNCWGATMFIAKAKDRLGWVENMEIGEWLQENSIPIKRHELKQGDVLALFDADKSNNRMNLVHTAVYLGGGRYVHKIGQRQAQTDTLKDVCKHYAYCGNSYVFMRLKGGENDT